MEGNRRMREIYLKREKENYGEGKIYNNIGI